MSTTDAASSDSPPVSSPIAAMANAELDRDDRIVDVTPEALVQILEIRAEEDDPGSLRLRIEVTGSRGVDYVYDLAFETEADAKDGDVVYPVDGPDGELTIVIPADSAPKLDGSVLDLPAGPLQSGLVLRNPNRPNPLAGTDLKLEGELPVKVQQLLDQSINPALAAHGGFVSLVGVEEADENRPGAKVYLSMGGGCQGCSLSAATMVEGVTSAIREALPEVAEVIDVTDHAAGENPFYA